MTKPAFFTPELADAICNRIADGRSLRSVCQDDDMPSRESVRRWLKEREDFRALYAEAHHERVDAMFEDMLAIADDRTIDWQERKVMIAARQWAMSKVAPKKYGDRVEVTGDPERPMVASDSTDLARRLLFLLQDGAQKSEAACRAD